MKWFFLFFVQTLGWSLGITLGLIELLGWLAAHSALELWSGIHALLLGGVWCVALAIGMIVSVISTEAMERWNSSRG